MNFTDTSASAARGLHGVRSRCCVLAGLDRCTVTRVHDDSVIRCRLTPPKAPVLCLLALSPLSPLKPLIFFTVSVVLTFPESSSV